MGNSDSHHSSSSRGASTNTQPQQHTNYPANTQQQAPQSSNQASNAQAPPGAYRMASAPRNNRFFVTIPRGVAPGQMFQVIVNGQTMMVKCPEENKPGDRLILTPPRQQQQQQQYVVTVPANVRPGQQFRVNINNQEVNVTCPRNVKPGQRVTFQLPTPQERPPAAAPNHQMFEVTVPDGVRPSTFLPACLYIYLQYIYTPSLLVSTPAHSIYTYFILTTGQPFALIANGQKVMVTCPPNVRPGQKIRFQLPIQLSQAQLETFKVNYDKDGWMRCLGQVSSMWWGLYG